MISGSFHDTLLHPTERTENPLGCWEEKRYALPKTQV